MTAENVKDLKIVKDFAKDVSIQFSSTDKMLADKLEMVLDIAKLFSEAKRKET